MKGIEFDALGARHCLRFDMNAICRLEEDFDATVSEIALRLGGEGARMTDLRLAFRAGLGPDVTLDRAGEIMTEIGASEAGRLIGEAMMLAFPTAAKSAKAAGSEKT
jgi:hypothetical protein